MFRNPPNNNHCAAVPHTHTKASPHAARRRRNAPHPIPPNGYINAKMRALRDRTASRRKAFLLKRIANARALAFAPQPSPPPIPKANGKILHNSVLHHRGRHQASMRSPPACAGGRASHRPPIRTMHRRYFVTSGAYVHARATHMQ